MGARQDPLQRSQILIPLPPIILGNPVAIGSLTGKLPGILERYFEATEIPFVAPFNLALVEIKGSPERTAFIPITSNITNCSATL